PRRGCSRRRLPTDAPYGRRASQKQEARHMQDTVPVRSAEEAEPIFGGLAGSVRQGIRMDGVRPAQQRATECAVALDGGPLGEPVERRDPRDGLDQVERVAAVAIEVDPRDPHLNGPFDEPRVYVRAETVRDDGIQPSRGLCSPDLVPEPL